jgi:Fe-S-cluster containining protein
VSETEFVLILDDLLRRLPAESCREIARRAKEFKRTLETEESEAAEKINGVVSLRDIFMLGRTLLPFECVLYKDGICRTPGVRPLACRGLDIPPEFLFLKTGEGVLFRRPLPLFYWFSLVFSDEELFGRLRDTPFYRDLLSLREAEYIERLAAYGTGCHDNT